MDNKSTVTTVSALQDYAKGQLVELPPFGEGQKFFARIRRPSMLALAKSNRIPNSLLNVATSLFNNDLKTEEMSDTFLKDMYEVINVLCEASFVDPTYKEIVDSGIELTDDQLIFVFNYTQRGVQALHSFRGE